jgi:hypothetical protein
MTNVNDGRWTAPEAPEGTAVFLIGMRFNKPWQVGKWWPVAMAMPRMLRYLADHEDSGLLGSQSWFGRTTMMLSYWRSAEHLQRFASAAEAPHREAWRAFRKAVGDDGSVGIWHETYVVGPGRAETLYGNMPAFGLGKATALVPVTAASATAKRRLAA